MNKKKTEYPSKTTFWTSMFYTFLTLTVLAAIFHLFRSLSFTVDVRTFNSCSVDSLTILNTGVAITLSNVAVTVEQD